VHGFSDHCNAYYDFFPSLASRGIAVYAFDQRGWGQSVSKKSQRGDTGPTSTILADIRSFLTYVNDKNLASMPLFLMGHSMGGAEVLLLSLLQSQPQPIPRISGLLLEAPYIGLHPAAKPSTFAVTAGKLASKVLPKHQLVQKLESKHLCRDPQVCRDWVNDELCHDTGTLECFVEMMQRAADLTALSTGQTVQGLGLKTAFGIDQPGSESVPIWIGHGTEDMGTSSAASETMFNMLDVKDKTLKLYDGAYHKLHGEPDGVAAEFANDVATWILERTSPEKHIEASDGIKPKL
jgi:acylglycerol lipase